jgi:hypothetical protein
MQGKTGVGLLDDRELAAYADQAQGLPEIACETVPGRFGFIQRPSPGSGPKRDHYPSP